MTKKKFVNDTSVEVRSTKPSGSLHKKESTWALSPPLQNTIGPSITLDKVRTVSEDRSGQRGDTRSQR